MKTCKENIKHQTTDRLSSLEFLPTVTFSITLEYFKGNVCIANTNGRFHETWQPAGEVKLEQSANSFIIQDISFKTKKPKQ